MTRLDDFLGPLNEGVWEVQIPKSDVTEPLDDLWVESPINIPTPKTIRSYRKGQYHVHEKEDEWAVHLDRHDPKKHPILHLIDDAPILLMILDTFMVFVSELKGKSLGTQEFILKQGTELKEEFVGSIILLVFGFVMILEPGSMYLHLMHEIIPIIVMGAGFLLIYTGVINKEYGEINIFDLARGVMVLILSVVLFYLPMVMWDLLLLLVLGIWLISSSIIIIGRAVQGKHKIPEGFYSRVVIGVCSLGMGVVIFISPIAFIDLFMIIAGALVFTVGIMVLTVTIRLWWTMHHPKHFTILNIIG